MQLVTQRVAVNSESHATVMTQDFMRVTPPEQTLVAQQRPVFRFDLRSLSTCCQLAVNSLATRCQLG